MTRRGRRPLDPKTYRDAHDNATRPVPFFSPRGPESFDAFVGEIGFVRQRASSPDWRIHNLVNRRYSIIALALSGSAQYECGGTSFQVQKGGRIVLSQGHESQRAKRSGLALVVLLRRRPTNSRRRNGRRRVRATSKPDGAEEPGAHAGAVSGTQQVLVEPGSRVPAGVPQSAAGSVAHCHPGRGRRVAFDTPTPTAWSRWSGGCRNAPSKAIVSRNWPRRWD